uniref:Alpha-2-HS-glycoprotein-like n=1 Tax=Sphaeramia orbicularis TaxID=375764 RepID=A0A673C967_9TELE
TWFHIKMLIAAFTLCLDGDGLVLVPIELAPIPCNDKAVEKLSRLAVTYINEDRADGYKFALNRIANVHLHAQGPAGNVYYLDLDVLETKCHTGSPKPWKRCDVRPFMETQISGNCNTTILHTQDGYSYLYSYDCFLIPDPPEKLQKTCPTCPLLLPEDSPQASSAAQITLASYKRKSMLGAGLGVKKITRAAAQVRELIQLFVFSFQTTGFCTGSVLGDFNNHPEVQVSCEMFKVQVPEPEPEPAPADPTLPPAIQPEPFDPAPAPPAPFDPPVVARPSDPFLSSSSESFEVVVNHQQRPPAVASSVSSSEEIGGPVAMRPPLNFRYQRRDRRKRQALMETIQPSHNPVFLTDFPDGPSPFRSCPGPSRYTTV